MTVQNILSKNENDVEKIEYLDDLSANQQEYWGWAALGTATSASTWRIMRITYATAALTTYVIEWANYGHYVSEWDNATTESYL